MTDERDARTRKTVGEAEPRGPGRPKDPEKGAAIIAAAKALFLEKGLEAVRMDDVANAAGVTKMTVYSHFHDKTALFAACVHAVFNEVMLGLEELPESAPGADLEARLISLGTAFLKMVLDPRAIAAFHMFLPSLTKQPELAAAFYESGYIRLRHALAEILETAAHRGELEVDSALDAADDLLCLWRGQLEREIALGIRAAPNQAFVKRRVQRGTAVFLRAYRPRASLKSVVKTKRRSTNPH